ncbi:hypothetical protein [Vibrio vulnificus]|uniref:hypothetical protein n=1 Tax=Vibrio vulnificus TaxID=672 RepID=UPI0024DF3792|nr:hypothetical protein [Vibrio vulnificus]MDK2679245.1 hypothetical protein [Vibrio vulnificus]MDK2688026.1 hypothetical protein [Vibrio vulnificus]
MFTSKNGCRIPTQPEYEANRRKLANESSKQKGQTRRLIEAIEERRGIDALFNYLQ